MPKRADEALWRKAVAGDVDALEQAVAPFRELLLRNARRAIMERRTTGELNEDDLTPEELVGETLLRAYHGRERYPAERMGLDAWLLALQRRALDRIARQEAEYRDRKAISLQEEIPFRADYGAVEEAFYAFDDPFDVTTYDELIPAQAPDDVELDTRRPLAPEELEVLERAGLDPRLQQIVELHDEFELELDEVARILEQSLRNTAEELALARAHVRQWLGSRDAQAYHDRTEEAYRGDRPERT